MSIDIKRDVDIVDVAKRLGIHIDPKNIKYAKEQRARCPFCDDKKFHLSFYQDSNVFRCNRCGKSGGLLHLILNMVSGIEDTKEAYKWLCDNLGFDGTNYSYKSKETPSVIKQYNKSMALNSIKPIDDRDRVYNALLDNLVLSEFHKNALLKRGLSKQAVHENKYRSIPQIPEIRVEVCRKLTNKGLDLKGIPGFYTNKAGEWDFYNCSGILIPGRTMEKKIQGFQVRKDNYQADGKKYTYFSSTDRPNGTPAESYVHIIGRLSPFMRLTEGWLKGDVANDLNKKLKTFNDEGFLCIPGVNATKHLFLTLQELKIEKLIGNFDMDQFTNKQVREAIEKIKMFCFENGIFYYNESWDRKFKGIDDYRYHLAFEVSKLNLTSNNLRCNI